MNGVKILVQIPFIFFWNWMITIKKKIIVVRKHPGGSATRRSLLWLVLTVIFGLLQFGIVFEQNMVLNINPAWEYKKLIMSGALVFFSTTLVASLTIDYFLLREIVLSKPMTGFLFVLFPVVILILSISLFTAFHGKALEEINFEFVSNMELVIFTTTAIYSFWVKLVLYLKTEQKTKQQDEEQK